jgi:hypothetical protein
MNSASRGGKLFGRFLSGMPQENVSTMPPHQPKYSN